MEKLWSPWRSKYIESFKAKDEKNNCVFCSEIDRDINSDESLKIYEGTNCFVMLNLYPYNNGHIMIIPYAHKNDFLDLEDNVVSEMYSLLKVAIKSLKNLVKPQGFNFGANLGTAAGAGIESHIHLHLVPRWNGDTNFMPALGEVKVISQDLLSTKNSLKVEFNKFVSQKD